jgi:chromosome segregation ATPase
LLSTADGHPKEKLETKKKIASGQYFEKLCEMPLRFAFLDASISKVFLQSRGTQMLKKILIGSALTLATGGLVMGTSAYSYLKTGFHSLQDSLKDQIPIEVEIKRARELIGDLKPEIASNLKMIAREEVELNKLQREVAAKQASVTKSKDSILKLKEDLQSGMRYVTYQGKKYSIDQVRQDLSDRFKHHQTLEATSEKLVKILDARERNLVAARRKLDEMLSAKRELEVQVENLQARLTMVQVAQTGSKFAFDESALGQVRQSLDEIATRIDVAEKLANGLEQIGSVPVEPTANSEDLIEKISDYFQQDTSGTSASAELDHLAEIPR